MSTYTEKVGDKLNDILEKTYDAEKGFKKAADNTDNVALKTYFENKAKQRYDFGHELKDEIASFGQKVEKGDSFTSKAHRAWMDVKALFSSDDAESMLEEAIRGEKAAVEEYNEVLQETSLPSSTSAVLKSQKHAIENGLSNIKTLEDLA
ncbi:PA2169 family four-helix-bundle protein [Maribacter litopenaei]|uniref:PA2169 family four-helix-bundle protein n=1 Tax=Maribacter litopenaei TaxID=2976127 RepID=A0ABY5Y7U2_9FLAO|nr:PA2169 family four-helix-bundle protein [Maribacter litopenaei]UWX54437.1 PA2169 family four-helix-bundle protein [Maribacter litopenaei]